jgi:hypothetical protein
MKYKLIIALAVVVVVVAGGWWAWRSQSAGSLANLANDPTAKLTDGQVQDLVAQIGKFMVVPSDEKPSVVVLRDTATLAQQQPFYRGAKDGDILVIYSNRAIIYDPKDQKLVNVGPIQRNDATPVPSSDVTASGSAQATPSASPSASPAAPEKVTVDVRNGTSTAGLAGTTASELKKNKWVTIGKTGDAKGAYSKTVLVDLSKGKKPGAIAQLEKLLGVTAVTEVPKGESTSTADVLVIVGK